MARFNYGLGRNIMTAESFSSEATDQISGLKHGSAYIYQIRIETQALKKTHG